jgi:hypothetical protein
VAGDGTVGDPFVVTPIYSGSGLPLATMERYEANLASTVATSQALRLTSLVPRLDHLSTGIRVYSGNAGTLTSTLVRIGLYSINKFGDGTLIASTPNDTTLFSVANTTYSKNWSVPISVQQDVRYAVGIVIVYPSGAPTIVGATLTTQGQVEALALPWAAARMDSQPDLPSSFLYSALTASNLPAYARLL